MRAVSVSVKSANGVKLPDRDALPSRWRNPPLRTCHRFPETVTIPVPGGACHRQRANRVPLVESVEGRVPLVTWTPSQGSEPSGTAHQDEEWNLSAADWY